MDKDLRPGPPWVELNESLHGTALWVDFTGVKDDEPSPFLVKVRRLGSFKSGGVFLLAVLTKNGEEIRLMGHCSHFPEEPAQYELLK